MFLVVLIGSIQADDNDMFSMELTPSKVIRGQNAIIRIRTYLPWSDNISIVQPVLGAGLTWWAYPYARSWYQKDEEGQNQRMIEVVASVQVNSPGFHYIEPFVITVGQIELKTPLASFIGVAADEKDLPYPIFTKWRDIPDTIWQGQSIPLVLEAQNLPYIVLSESVKFNQVPGGLLDDAPGLGEIVTHSWQTDIIYDVPMASWLWTLDQPGTFSFPSTRLVVNGLIRTTPGFSVTVKAMPNAVSESGAVGNFYLTTKWDDKPYTVGQILSMRVRIEGEGNMNVLKLPVPVSNEAQLVSTGSSSSYLPSFNGYSGWREERFDFRLTQAGNIRIDIPQWAWLDPSGEGRIQVVPSKSHMILIAAPTGSVVMDSADYLLGDQLFGLKRTRFHAHNLSFYLLLLPGIIVLIFPLIFRRYKLRLAILLSAVMMLTAADKGYDEGGQKAAKAKNLALDGQWEKSEIIYDALANQFGEIPGLLHDRAIVAMELDHPDKSITLLYRSLYLRPASSQLVDTLQFVEERLGLSDQVDIGTRWSVSLAFAIWLFLFNILCFFISKLFYKRDASRYIQSISAGILLLSSTVFLLYTELAWEKKIGVVTADSQSLRKIPGPLANEWIKLPDGSTVFIDAIEDDDCLVHTSYGLQGWLPLDSLNFIQEDTDGL